MTPAVAPQPELNARPRIAVSACLLGHGVRYDGGHKAHAFTQTLLSQHVDYVAICPEVGIGLGIPRTPIHLVRQGWQTYALIQDEQQSDITQALRDYATAQLPALQGICGYVFKSRSPSCGLQGVPLFTHDQPVSATGRGIFAEAISQALPALPLEEETRLAESATRDSFLKRVFAWHRWQQQAAHTDFLSVESFHRQHNLLLMAHGMKGLHQLSRKVDDIAQNPAVIPEYFNAFMAHLQQPVTHTGNGMVLKFLQRELKNRTMMAEGARIEAAVAAYESGDIGLHEPRALLQAALHRLGLHHYTQQAFFEPFPDALAE